MPNDDWTGFVTEHVPRLRGFLRTLVRAEHVDDLVNEAFARVLGARVAGKPIENLRAFLYGVTRNCVREHLRTALKQPDADLDNVTALQLDPRPSSMLAREVERVKMLDAMRSLTLDHQMVLQLFYWEDLTSREIGLVLEINENTARGRLTRARDALAARMD